MKFNEQVKNLPLLKGSSVLQNKWKGMLKESKFDRRKMNNFDQSNIATLIENQSKLYEASAQDVTGLQTVFMSLVRRVYPNLIANDMFGIQALDRPGGIVFYLKAFLKTGDKSYLSSAAKTNEIGVWDKDNLGGQLRYDSSYSDAFATATVTPSAVASGAITYDTTLVGKHAYNVDVAGQMAVRCWANGKEIGTVRLENSGGVNAYTYVADSATGLCLNTGTTITATVVTPTGDRTLTFAGNIAFDGVGDSVDQTIVEYRTVSPHYNQEGNGTYGNAYGGNWPIPEVEFQFQSQAINVKSRKLKTGWPLEMEQDMKAYHNENPEELLTNFLSMQISLDIDRELIAAGRSSASFIYDYDFRSPLGASLPTGSGLRLEDYNQGIAIALNFCSNEIYKRSLRGQATFAVTNPTVAARLQSLNTYRADVSKDASEITVGIETAGTLGRKLKIICDPIYPSDEVFLGYKGSSPIESGLVFAPYQAIMSTNTLQDPSDMTAKKALMSRYGILLTDRGSNFYARLGISNLPENDLTNSRITNLNTPGLPVMPMGNVTTGIDAAGLNYLPNALT